MRDTISIRIAEGLFHDARHKTLHDKVIAAATSQKPIIHEIGKDETMSDDKNLDTIYLSAVKQVLDNNESDSAQDNANMYQQFRTLYLQTMTAVGIRHMLPPGLSGLFCLLMIMAMISTDDTRMFSSAITISQDVILPFLKKPLTPVQHMWMLRFVSLGV